MEDDLENNVLVLKIDDSDCEAFMMDTDLTDEGTFQYMENQFANELIQYLPEYALGEISVSSDYRTVVKRLNIAARSVIKVKGIQKIKEYIDNNVAYEEWEPELLKFYRDKGIFSELILHYILRQFNDTVPLISKIYFKDSFAIEAHGFDAVHITPSDKRLWLGEAKFYTDGKEGLKALIDDLNKHFVKDYLNEQFVIIHRQLEGNSYPNQYWVEKISNCNKLSDMFDFITVPLLCVYENKVAKTILDLIQNSKEWESVYFEHIDSLRSYFKTHNNYRNRNRLQILLILLPVESKDRIINKMLELIFSMQNIQK